MKQKLTKIIAAGAASLTLVNSTLADDSNSENTTIDMSGFMLEGDILKEIIHNECLKHDKIEGLDCTLFDRDKSNDEVYLYGLRNELNQGCRTNPVYKTIYESLNPKIKPQNCYKLFDGNVNNGEMIGFIPMQSTNGSLSWGIQYFSHGNMKFRVGDPVNLDFKTIENQFDSIVKSFSYNQIGFKISETDFSQALEDRMKRLEEAENN